MRIGIITFQETNNYGAILQNFALQHTIKKMGHEPETIDYRSRYISKPYKLSHLKNKGMAKYLFGVAGYICYLPRQKRNDVFRKLIKYSLPVMYNELPSLNAKYDCFITGSDQVWNVQLTGYDDTYFLGFVQDSKKKNSFAASIGMSCLSDSDQSWYKEKLQDFQNITVRETRAVGVLNDFLEKKVKDVVDPVFLLQAEEWNTLVKSSTSSEEYILVYQLGLSKELVKYAKGCAKEYKCKLIFVPFPLVGIARGKYAFGAGAGDVLNYIRHAKYVITDSFHGTALSIIFNKKFTTLVSGTHSSVSSRLIDMLKNFELEDRMWNPNFKLHKEINYAHTNELLVNERQKAFILLSQILNEER